MARVLSKKHGDLPARPYQICNSPHLADNPQINGSFVKPMRDVSERLSYRYTEYGEHRRWPFLEPYAISPKQDMHRKTDEWAGTGRHIGRRHNSNIDAYDLRPGQDERLSMFS